MLEYKIRPIAEKDIPVFLHLVRELAESQQSLADVTATEEGLRECFFGSRPSAEVAVAEIANEVIGYAVFFTTNSTYKAKPPMFLEDLYVRPKYRGQGIGKALFLHVVKLAHDRNCMRVDWLAYDWNKKALDFYFGLGAIVRGEVRPYRLNQDAIEKLVANS